MSRGISIKLLESNSQIAAKINKSIAEQINKRIAKNKRNVIRSLKSAVGGWVRSSPEVGSLLSKSVGGSLSSQFGLTAVQADAAVNRIVSAVSDSLIVTLKPVDSKLKSTIDFRFQKTDFLNLLSLSEGHVITEKGQDLHWLDWLIMKGDITIVLGYSYVAGPVGRSGGGEMNIGGMWRVPPEFSGTQGNNFITRALDGHEKEIHKILEGLLV
tara:strand:+ start:15130 stop:15768 length:639 start_codon:yes stop_codon:yes gene_type:complete